MTLELKLGYDVFKVLPLPPALHEAEQIDGRINWHRDGHAGDCVILISAKERPKRQAEILIHELLHAAYYVGELGDGKKCDEETVVTGLDGPLTSFLNDNPELFAVLMQAIHRGVPIVTPAIDEPSKGA